MEENYPLAPVPQRLLEVMKLDAQLLIPRCLYEHGHEGIPYSTLDDSKPEVRQLIVKALQGDPEKGDKWINRTIHAVGFTFASWSKLNEHGEQVGPMPMTVIHGHDGEMCCIFSDKIIKSLRLCCWAGWLPSEKRPLSMKLERKPCGDGSRSFYQFVLDGPAVNGKAAKK